jgi:hypothetical protein
MCATHTRNRRQLTVDNISKEEPVSRREYESRVLAELHHEHAHHVKQSAAGELVPALIVLEHDNI